MNNGRKVALLISVGLLLIVCVYGIQFAFGPSSLPIGNQTSYNPWTFPGSTSPFLGGLMPRSEFLTFVLPFGTGILLVILAGLIKLKTSSKITDGRLPIWLYCIICAACWAFFTLLPIVAPNYWAAEQTDGKIIIAALPCIAVVLAFAHTRFKPRQVTA